MHKIHWVGQDWLRTRRDLNEIRVYSTYCELDLYDRDNCVRATTVFDVCDLVRLSPLKWTQFNNEGYIRHNASRTYLHRLILEAPKELQVDHVDGNVLNNRRANLRLVTPIEQNYNRTPIRSNTGVKGVSYSSTRGLYKAKISSDCKEYYSCFSTLKEAEHWVRKKRTELHGEFANHGN